MGATLGYVTADAELLRALHDDHAQALLSFVIGLNGGDRVKAQDVVQETLLRAWRNPQVLDGSRSPRSWLLTVARRIVIDDWRSSRRTAEVITAEVPDRGHPDATEDSLNRVVVSAALQTLSAEHRDAVVECYYRGSSVAQAAEALGIPPGTVKSRLHYGLRALRLAIEELHGELA
jgi:RNA polymerase sigma-70 factor (ECF subfamily)